MVGRGDKLPTFSSAAELSSVSCTVKLDCDDFRSLAGDFEGDRETCSGSLDESSSIFGLWNGCARNSHSDFFLASFIP